MRLPDAVYEDYTEGGKKHAEKLFTKLDKKYFDESADRIVVHDLVRDIQCATMFNKWGDFYYNAIPLLKNLCDRFSESFDDFCEFQGYKEGMSYRDLYFLIFTY